MNEQCVYFAKEAEKFVHNQMTTQYTYVGIFLM